MMTVQQPISETLPFERPAVMGIINVSPHSFYRPVANVTEALCAAESMSQAGAVIVDVGGEATNPQTAIQRQPSACALQEEMDRVLPVIEAIAARLEICISVDTSQPQVMREAVSAGARIINDQRALREPQALETVAALPSVPVCLMHGLEPLPAAPQTPAPLSSSLPLPDEPLAALLLKIKRELAEAVERCEQAGIARDRLLIDPGFGQGHFGKNTEENYYLLAHLSHFQSLGLPILVGWSRKSMLGEVLGGAPPAERLYASVAAAVIAAMQGAAVIRVHDVKETMEAVQVFRAMAVFRPPLPNPLLQGGEG